MPLSKTPLRIPSEVGAIDRMKWGHTLEDRHGAVLAFALLVFFWGPVWGDQDRPGVRSAGLGGPEGKERKRRAAIPGEAVDARREDSRAKGWGNVPRTYPVRSMRGSRRALSAHEGEALARREEPRPAASRPILVAP
jgi:hypothetical protein